MSLVPPLKSVGERLCLPPKFLLASAREISLVPDGATNLPLTPISLYFFGAETTLFAAGLGAHDVYRRWQIQLEYHAPKLTHRDLCRSADVLGFCPSMTSN